MAPSVGHPLLTFCRPSMIYRRLPQLIEKIRRNFISALWHGAFLCLFIGIGALLARRLPGPEASRTFRVLEKARY